jgi:hypothetical protein
MRFTHPPERFVSPRKNAFPTSPSAPQFQISSPISDPRGSLRAPKLTDKPRPNQKTQIQNAYPQPSSTGDSGFVHRPVASPWRKQPDLHPTFVAAKPMQPYAITLT